MRRPAWRRLALVFSSFSGGGMERSMLRLADGLMARGIAVDFVVGEARGELLAEVSTKASVIVLPKGSVWRACAYGLSADPTLWALALRLEFKPLKRLLRRLPGLVRYLRTAGPDAILAAEPRYNALAVWGRRLSGLDSRVVISERNQPSLRVFPGPWGEAGLHGLLKAAYLKADAIVAVSDGVADDLAAHVGIPRDRITTIYNPIVGPDLLAKAQAPLDHAWFAADQPPVILAAGRLHPQKDFATLLRAFATVRARRSARLVILGAVDRIQPAYADELQGLAETLGIARDVAMPGFVDNPFAFMTRASVFVLSSRYEGLPGALIQAMACGCPVVSTDCPSGPREILDGGRLGPLVPVGDAGGLAQAIETMLDAPPPVEHLQSRADIFTVQRAVDSYLKLLFRAGEELCGRVAA